MLKEEVYRILRSIPEGKVTTYGRIALMLGNKNYARTVGNILNKNPDGDFNPCYKVVTRDGRLSEAYAFGGIDAQRKKLENDGVEVVNNRVDLKKYLW